MSLLRNFRRKNFTHHEQMEEQQRIESLEFETVEDKTLFHEARIGLEVAEFWNSDAGLYLRKRCADIVRESTQRLISLSPMDYDGIGTEQVNIKAAQTLVRMVTDAIANGESSELEIINREENRDE